MVKIPNKDPITQEEIDELKKEDLILLVRRKKLPYTSGTLWKLNREDLLKIISSTSTKEVKEIDDENDKTDKAVSEINGITRKNLNYIHDRVLERKKYSGIKVNALKSLLKERGIVPSNKTKGGMIDALLDEPAISPITPDPDQQIAINRRYDANLIINAGPGSGKTSTLCRIIAESSTERPHERILVLVYNKNAEAVVLLRLRALACRLIPKKEVFNTSFKGVAVLTFHKYAYQVNSTLGDNRRESYRIILEVAANNIHKTKNKWDAVVLDEAQDMTNDHVNLAMGTLDNATKNNPVIIEESSDSEDSEEEKQGNSLITNNGSTRPRLCIAGDPRQELYSGAVFFSHLWKHSPEEDKCILRYNHRSSKSIVAILNKYSKFNFPTLHHDQIATSDEEGEFRVYVSDDEKERGEMIGFLMSQCEPGEAYALAPVTIDKFGMDVTTTVIRQTVEDVRPGAMINIFGDYTPHSYDIGTAKKHKGSERSTVVGYGVELDYSKIIDEVMIRKMVYVVLSRAQDNLYLVIKSTISVLLECIVTTKTTANKSGVKVSVLKNDNRYSGPPSDSVDVAGSRIPGLETGLSKCESITVLTISEDKTSAFALPTMGGPDFVGIYAESLIAKALGLPLFNADNITITKSSENKMLGPYCKNGTFYIEVPANKINTMKKLLEECKQLQGNDAFSHATLMYSFLIGKLWTVSKKITTIDTDKLSNKIAKFITENTPPDSKAFYLQHHSKDLPFRRGGTATKGGNYAGRIGFIPDIMMPFPIEIKHVLKLEECHRRQCGIYACLTGHPFGLLINTFDGVVEYVNATDMQETLNTARAVLAMKMGREQALGKLSHLAIRPPSNLVSNCIIIVDIESDTFSSDNVTEIGAVALNVNTFEILGVYDKRPPCVRELEKFEIDMIEEESRNNNIEDNESDDELDTITSPDMNINNIKKTTKLEERKGRFTPCEKVTGLRVENYNRLGIESKLLIKDFSKWVKSISAKRCIMHWGGNESRLFGHLGVTIDLLHEGFRPWLEVNKWKRSNLTSLGKAAHQVVPYFKFKAHRSFEDVCATLAIFLAITSFSGVA